MVGLVSSGQLKFPRVLHMNTQNDDMRPQTFKRLISRTSAAHGLGATDFQDWEHCPFWDSFWLNRTYTTRISSLGLVIEFPLAARRMLTTERVV